MTARIRALVVDDEPMGRELLRHDLAEVGGIDVVGEAADGGAAVEAVTRLRPDVVFLDIEMPGKTGLGVVRTLERPPLVVFVTAHEEFALEAFDLDVLDYLTKPVRRGRLAEAVERVRRELRHREAASEDRPPGECELPQRWNDALLGPDGRISRFVARSGTRVRLVRAEAVHWARSAGNYVELHTVNGRHLVRMTLADLERGLDPHRFRRIHRSHLVNLDRIAEIRSDGHGSWDVELKGGQVLRMTPTYRDAVLGVS